MPYLGRAEMDALLSSPDCQTAQGRRDHALLLFLYNSGARADEAARLTVADLDLLGSASVKILGKGNRERRCPLWPATVRELTALVANRAPPPTRLHLSALIIPLDLQLAECVRGVNACVLGKCKTQDLPRRM